MKPKTLRFPFRWVERKPILSDDVLYVPRHYDQHEAWDKGELEAILASFSSISIEYCAGNGLWIAQKAQENPSSLWIAVEKRFDRVQRIWAKKHNLSLNNLLVVAGEAEAFTSYYLKPEMIDQIFVNFPDPWPKPKHAKNRLLQKPFVEEMKRVLKPLGEVVLVTDDAVYSQQMIQEMMQEDLWRSSFPTPHYVTDWPSYGTSYFEELWKNQGRVIYYKKFIK